MKTSICDLAGGAAARSSRHKPRRKSIAAILRAAYQLHTRDLWTRRAVKRVLR
ncbi:MAG TPA: hypothetical protein VEO95_10310 [Chthoniobacteraceae bacterium]|nr:hypothetical protein [Chthoniobacteraceae bacterium]